MSTINLFKDPDPRIASEEKIRRDRRLAEALAAANAKQVGQPIGHWTQGAAQMVNSLNAALMARRADSQEKERNSALAQALMGTMQPGEGADPNVSLSTVMQIDPELGARIMQQQQARQAQAAAQQAQWKREDANWQRDRTARREDARYGKELDREFAPPQKPVALGADARLVDPATGKVIAEGMPAASKPTDDMREYEFAKQQGFQGSLQDWILSQKKAGAVTIDQRAESALSKKLGEGIGKVFSGFIEEGTQASEDIAQLNRLEQLLSSSPGGLTGAWQRLAGQYGLNIEGASDAQAAEAIISYLTPRMRVPGSGATSDREVSMFKQSLPTLMGTPEGNKTILDTMRGLATMKQARADIAMRLATGEIDPQKAMEALKSIPSPFPSMGDDSQAQQSPSAQGMTAPPDATQMPPPPQGVDPNLWQHMTPEERALWP